MKSDNLLVFRSQQVKIGDFGISIKMKPLKKEHSSQDKEDKYYMKGFTDGYVESHNMAIYNSDQPFTRE